ncbi:MAG: GNAT family N-acetyltransferase, partial [Trueperaceae bacterium]|nr:GNAT family N-acetyltransferase [Trueperaceae bacterium]
MPDLGSSDDDGAARELATGGSPPELVLRELTSHADLHEVERIQREVWGLDDLEVVPNSQLRAALHAGGQLGGAFLEDALVGFSYGFLASPHGRLMVGPGLHSHMAAVRPGARGRGVGRALKWQQRAWCLERGIEWMTWTFDPLQARNANLNLRHLGAVGVDYLVDFYGPMGGPLGGGRSDRLLALWMLTGQRVTARAEGGGPLHGPAVGARSALPVRERLATWAVRAASSDGDAEPVVELSEGLLARTVET